MSELWEEPQHQALSPAQGPVQQEGGTEDTAVRTRALELRPKAVKQRDGRGEDTML